MLYNIIYFYEHSAFYAIFVTIKHCLLMKKLLFVSFFVLFCTEVFSQNYKGDGEPYQYFSIISADWSISYCTGKMEIDGSVYKLADENGKPIRFKTTSELLNYLSKRGWHYAGIHFPEKSLRVTYNYMMYKEVTEDEQIKEGISLTE